MEGGEGESRRSRVTQILYNSLETFMNRAQLEVANAALTVALDATLAAWKDERATSAAAVALGAAWDAVYAAMDADEAE